MIAAPAALRFTPEDRATRELVRDLNQPRAATYWADLLITATIGWTAFGVAAALRPFSPAMVAAALVSAAALYRGLCFVHEISHQSHRSLPGFECAWNLLVGYPLLLPSFVYVGVHQHHHKLTTYGTSDDPEYLPFARNRAMTAMFAIESLLIPLTLAVRFLILGPLAFAMPPLHRWLIRHFSSLIVNVLWRREMTPELSRSIRLHTAAMLAVWAVFIGLIAPGRVPFRFAALWFAVSGLASFVNTLRTLGAHAYESPGIPLDRAGQLADSIDTPGFFWTELWAPVGLRYHALHHYFPGIPYHNLPEAWRRLSAALPPEALYHRVQSPSLPHSLHDLFRKGGR